MILRFLSRLIRGAFDRRSGSRGTPTSGAGSSGSRTLEVTPTVGARAMGLELSNVIAVARREYLSRARTRTFRLTTLLLIALTLGISLAPILIRFIDRGNGPARIEVFVGDSKPSVDVVAALGALLNAQSLGLAGATGGTGGTDGIPASPAPSPAPGSAQTPTASPSYALVATDDATAARDRVRSGASTGLLVVARQPTDRELVFTYITNAKPTDRLPQLVRQAAAAIAIQDRLTTAGIPPGDQAKLFAPPTFDLEAANPSAGSGPIDVASGTTGFGTGFVFAIVIFMAIVLYGQWVAYSVAEEKSSRVMEVILGAATPLELLAGKVAGVGGLAITQYAIVFVPAAIALIFQDQIAALVLGGRATAGLPAGLPAGLSIPLLLVFGVFFVLGFSLYAVLYAGAAALVSRTEDINQIVAPMTLVSLAGYLVAVYSSTGLIAPDSPIVRTLSFVPFFSPYLMISRMGAGTATTPEVLLAIAILVVSVPIALWIAARLYAAGVLMYGQRPSVRLIFRVLRGT